MTTECCEVGVALHVAQFRRVVVRCELDAFGSGIELAHRTQQAGLLVVALGPGAVFSEAPLDDDEPLLVLFALLVLDGRNENMFLRKIFENGVVPSVAPELKITCAGGQLTSAATFTRASSIILCAARP